MEPRAADASRTHGQVQRHSAPSSNEAERQPQVDPANISPFEAAVNAYGKHKARDDVTTHEAQKRYAWYLMNEIHSEVLKNGPRHVDQAGETRASCGGSRRTSACRPSRRGNRWTRTAARTRDAISRQTARQRPDAAKGAQGHPGLLSRKLTKRMTEESRRSTMHCMTLRAPSTKTQGQASEDPGAERNYVRQVQHRGHQGRETDG